MAKSCDSTIPNIDSPISQFYAGKSVLVTGATGFIGKVLIEKLLYSCPDVDRIYCLIRSSKGKTPHGRLMEMISKKPFNIRLKPDFVSSKLTAIESDLAAPRLGLSDYDCATLVERISLIFHVAASVKFEAPLEVNMRHNVVATKELLDLACKFHQLECFVHVSTAYSNCQLRRIEEKVYPMEVPEDPMKLVVTKEMIDNRPNTYTYTKAMAENVASRYASKINMIIVRPSIVMSAIEEPTEGWVDTINGPVGLSVLGCLGILQKIKVNSEVVFDLIPVDTVANALISVAWAATVRRSEFKPSSTSALPQPSIKQNINTNSINNNNNNIVDGNINNNNSIPNNNNNNNELNNISHPDGRIRVFNLTSGSENPCSFYHYFSTGRAAAYKTPSARALRPILEIPKQKGMNRFLYWVYKIFSHLLFAYIVDFALGLVGQKKMAIKAVNRMHHANDMFDYFCSNQWHFVTDNVQHLRNLQSPVDRKKFKCDVRLVDWNLYAKIGWLGCRRFILNEPDETFEFAKRRYTIMCYIYYTTKIISALATTALVRWLLCANCSVLLSLTLLAPLYGVIYLL